MRKALKFLTWAAFSATLLLVLLALLIWYVLSDDFPEPEKSDVIGTWESNRDGPMEFHRNGTFTAHNIALDYACTTMSLQPKRVSVSGKGTWELGTFPDESPGARISFNPKAAKSLHSYEMWTSFITEDFSKLSLLSDGGTGEWYKRANSNPDAG